MSNKDGILDPIKSRTAPIVEYSGLLDCYVHLLELEKQKIETLGQIIYAVIMKKVEGTEREKRTLIETIRKIDHHNNPEKLRTLINDVIDGKEVRAFDMYRESFLGYKKFKFSKKFIASLKKTLYKKSSIDTRN